MEPPVQLRSVRYQPAYNRAVGTVEPYRGTDHTVATMVRLLKSNGTVVNVDPLAMVSKALDGEQSFLVRRHTEQIIGNVRPKDYSSEIVAILKWWTNAIRYTRDPVHVEMLRTPDRLVLDANSGKLCADCFPEGMLMLAEGHRFVPVEHLRVGDKIWGHDRWSTIEAWSEKGVLPLDAIKLNNGNWIKLTRDHKVYVAECSKHRPENRPNTGPCTCRLEEREIKRITVGELQSGMVMLQPKRIAFGEEEMDPRRALIEGFYLSDGWSNPYSFSISGQDGCPKEEQKREVERLCAELSVETTWLRKSITVRDSAWTAERIHLMGAHAPEKRALSISLGEGAAAALLRGILADSGKNSAVMSNAKTLTSTSKMLAMQARVLLRMFGISASYSYIEDHGGLGKNPIWRISTRERTDGKAEKLLRVKEIVRDADIAPCYDITTDDHYVYLPEQDVTVSNCDEAALAIAAGCLSIGAPAQIITVGFRPRRFGGPKVHTHVFTRAQDPRTSMWWVLDPVAGRRTSQMLSRVKDYSIFDIERDTLARAA